MLRPRNGLGLEAKNYGLGLGVGLVASGLGAVDAVSSALRFVTSWPHYSLGKHYFMFRF